jgi:hypothetical protein
MRTVGTALLAVKRPVRAQDRICHRGLPARLAGRVRDRRAGQHRGQRQLQRGRGSGPWPRLASGSWRWTVQTARTGTATASPIRWIRSARRGPRNPGVPTVCPRAGDGAVEAIPRPRQSRADGLRGSSVLQLRDGSALITDAAGGAVPGLARNAQPARASMRWRARPYRPTAATSGGVIQR